VVVKYNACYEIAKINYKSEISFTPITKMVCHDYSDVYEEISEVFVGMMIAYFYALFQIDRAI